MVAPALLVLLAVAACSQNDGTPGDAGGEALPPDAGWTPADVAGHVNPLIGTKGGETWPGAVVPFGMVQLSPENTYGDQTRTPAPGGYAYAYTKIRGFSLTHLSGTGCAGAFGDIPIFPYPDAVSSSPSADSTDAIYASSFSHANEQARAGYYKVKLDSGVQVELSATARTGSARFTFPAGKTASLLFRTSSSELGTEDAKVTVDAKAGSVSGWVKSGNFCGYIYGSQGNINRRSYYTLHFYAELDRPISGSGTWKDATVTPGGTSASGGTGYGDGFPPKGKGSGAYATLDTGGKPVNLRVGISFVSAANARANLAAENPSGTTLETVSRAAHAAWNAKLARVEVQGGTPDQLAIFYTALYHALLHPNLFSDVNGEYMGLDQKVHKVSASQQAQYANFSGWDVYRGQLQLVALLEPAIAGDIAQSLLNQANQNKGVWDRWTHGPGATHVMTGDPAHVALPTIYAFGATGFDAASALTSMVHAATTVTAEDLSKLGWNVMVVGERPSLDKYLALHYVPADGNAWHGASETLEDVAADFALAQLAGRLGQSATKDQFLARSAYWKNIFNPDAVAGGSGYMQNRYSTGAWVTPFDPAQDNSFVEGSAAQYTWMVPFDMRGLLDAMGGDAKAEARLDAFFKDKGSWTLTKSGGGHAEMNNEPSIGAPFVYSFAKAPHKAQQTVRQVQSTLWKNAPEGIPGQDDLGAMSAWYVWTALGLYPQYPGRAELLLCAPLFSKSVIRRQNGKTVTISAPQAAADAMYVQALKVNGQVSTRAWLPESFVSSGGTLDFTLAKTASKSWGAGKEDAPPSFPAPGP